MKYILDFDRTLFHTELLYEALDRDGVDRTILVPAIWESYQAKDFLYPDTVPFFTQHNPDDLIILTAYGTKYGDQVRAYQQAKVEQAPILDLVSQIHFVEHDKVTIMQTIATTYGPDEPLVFVDDLLEHCLAVKAAVPDCQCYLIQRTSSPITPPTGITVIQNLTELPFTS